MTDAALKAIELCRDVKNRIDTLKSNKGEIIFCKDTIDIITQSLKNNQINNVGYIEKILTDFKNFLEKDRLVNGNIVKNQVKNLILANSDAATLIQFERQLQLALTVDQYTKTEGGHSDKGDVAIKSNLQKVEAETVAISSMTLSSFDLQKLTTSTLSLTTSERLLKTVEGMNIISNMIDPRKIENKYVGDDDSEGLPHGQGMLYCRDSKDGLTMYSGEWVHGQRCGVGKLICFDENNKFRQLYDGEWKNGEKHGKGFCQFANGSTYIGYWSSGKFVRGTERSFVTYGSLNPVTLPVVYTGSFSTRYTGNKTFVIVRQGNGTSYEPIVYTNGKTTNSVFHGRWRNGKKNGRGYFEDSEGKSFKGTWLDGERHGYGEEIDTNNDFVEVGTWKSGKVVEFHGLKYSAFQSRKRIRTIILVLSIVLVTAAIAIYINYSNYPFYFMMQMHFFNDPVLDTTSDIIDLQEEFFSAPALDTEYLSDTTDL